MATSPADLRERARRLLLAAVVYRPHSGKILDRYVLRRRPLAQVSSLQPSIARACLDPRIEAWRTCSPTFHPLRGRGMGHDIAVAAVTASGTCWPTTSDRPVMCQQGRPRDSGGCPHESEPHTSMWSPVDQIDTCLVSAYRSSSVRGLRRRPRGDRPRQRSTPRLQLFPPCELPTVP
jgi:hypothetical protein